MIINPRLPTGFVIFSDDLRQEVTGKIIIVGAYSHDMIFTQPPPVILPQLVASIWYRLSPEEVPSSIEFRVVFETADEEPAVFYSHLLDLTKEELPTGAPSPDANAVPYLEITHVAQLSNLVIAKPGSLRVRAYFDDNEVRLGTIMLNFPPPEVTPNSSSAEISV